MADQVITIPNGSNEEEYRGWVSEAIDDYLAAGKDVIFQDEDSVEKNVNYFAFLADTTTERTLKFRGVGMDRGSR